MSNYEILKEKIQIAVPSLMDIEVGQIFHSKFYGNITATKIIKYHQNAYSIYGFDTEKGLPRSEMYPRDLKLLGKEPTLSDVLEWINTFSQYTDEYCITIGGYFLKMNFTDHEFELINSHTNPKWDMSKPYLKDQSLQLIEWLNTLN